MVKKVPLDLDKNYFDGVDAFFKYMDKDNVLDDQSAKDLDIMEVYHLINQSQSSIGDEFLYAQLRNQNSQNNLELFERKIKEYTNDPYHRINNQLAFQKISRRENNGLYDFIKVPQSFTKEKQIIQIVQAVLAVLALISLLINLEFGIFAVTIMFILNQISYHSAKKETLKRYNVLKTYGDMVDAAKKMSESSKNDSLIQAINKFKNISIYKSFLIKDESFDLSGMNYIAQALSAYFMTHVLAYNKILSLSQKYRNEAEEIYKSIGYEEMCISVASYRESLNYYSIPNFVDEDSLKFEGLYHPLIENPVSYDKVIEDKILLTGSNASGKSTFVKTLALNMILSKSINTSLSYRYQSQNYYVQTSMAISDDVQSGDSYFVAEIKSIKELLKTAKNKKSMIIIDEVLKGTNTIERIAASAAVLDQLSKTDSFICAASHDIELTRILENKYNNYHFRESFDENGITFDYCIYDGPSKSKNAIRLLEVLKYPDQIVEDAKNYAHTFENESKWLVLS